MKLWDGIKRVVLSFSSINWVNGKGSWNQKLIYDLYGLEATGHYSAGAGGEEGHGAPSHNKPFQYMSNAIVFFPAPQGSWLA